MSQQLYAAIDVGGTKIAAALVDAEGTLLTRAELPTPPKGSGGEEVMATVGALVDALAEDARWADDVVGVGIGSAGPVDPTRGTVSPVNIPGWRDFPIVDQVKGLKPVGGLEVVLVGDGSAMAAGEHWRGAARGYDNALCLVVSTGVGAGLILDGVLRTGPSGNAGHLGHISVDVEGEDCPCGSRGCLETIASGTSIARWAVQNGWRMRSDNVVETNFRPTRGALGSVGSGTALDPDVTVTTAVTTAAVAAADMAASAGTEAALTTTAITGSDITEAALTAFAVTAADIAASARAGDEIALAAFERAGRALAAGIAATAMLVDIRAAVIGGGVAKSGEVLFDPLRRHLNRYASLPFTHDLDILPAKLGGDAGLIGAVAALARPTRG